MTIDVSSKLSTIAKNIMDGLKDFQQATVNRIDQLFKEGQKRILVSDEVGLGKTLIARGTIAKLALYQKEHFDNLVKVVYICSNGAIAEQNLKKLRIVEEVRTESMRSSRLSMQHLAIFNQENDSDLLRRYIQLIPLTPDTSFRITSGAGTVSERALMFAILSRLESLQEYLPELEVVMIHDANVSWYGNDGKNAWEKAVLECDKNSDGGYISYMKKAVQQGLEEKQADGASLIEKVIEACLEIREKGIRGRIATLVIGKLRLLFSKISLDKLEPDLVIMDEFQRFKYLLDSDPTSEMGMLSQKFFSANDVKMLLLSATPYKMYSTLEEIDESLLDEHFIEFWRVMEFLCKNKEEYQYFKEVWSDYSIKLKEFSSGDCTILSAKKRAEEETYKRVCRTERVSAREISRVVDDSSIKTPIKVLEQDVKSYLALETLLRAIGSSYHAPVEYVKSSPYLLSFMRDYQLKRDIERYFLNHPTEVGKARSSTLWINEKKIDKFEPVPSGNARLETLKECAFSQKAEKLLWVPPSKPYYEPQGVYKNVKRFSKILVFSAWEMVPRMISGMLSYEAERKTIGELAKVNGEQISYFYSENATESAKRKRYPLPKLNFAVKEEKANAMTLFCLLYPSEFLSKCYNPIECLNQGLSLKQIEKKVGEMIEKNLCSLSTTGEGVDFRWYYMAPILLDSLYSKDYYDKWMDGVDLLLDSDEEVGGKKRNAGLATHISELRELKQAIDENQIVLGGMPSDLVSVLVNMAIASPSVCINRTYRKYLFEESDYNTVYASAIAKSFINRMNSPESTAVVELSYMRNEKDVHWRDVLNYCKDGNLQAVFDEYAHLLVNGLERKKGMIKELHNNILESMAIRTASYGIDTFSSFKKKVCGKKERTNALRTHFAVAFTKGEGNSVKDADRKRIVRNAFNSPFRPFVLASTSIGQEGLDFHNYCRKIVHWNLPSNPIDLEQREGRIDRFECLAIRQNLAERYGSNQFKEDIWKEMFEIAQKDCQERNQHSSDLIPFWVLPEKADMVKIERIVPAYPFSKDFSVYERLIKILSLYRLTLGHSRQEELLEYVLKKTEEGEKFDDFFINLSPHYRKDKPTNNE